MNFNVVGVLMGYFLRFLVLVLAMVVVFGFVFAAYIYYRYHLFRADCRTFQMSLFGVV